MKHTLKPSTLALRRAVVLCGTAAALSLGGCAATQMALAHKDLDVQVFLGHDLILPLSGEKTVSVQVRNSTQLPLDAQVIRQQIIERLQAKGYTVVEPAQAHYAVSLSIYHADVQADAAGGGGTQGFISGAAAGGINGNTQGALIGALVGGTLDTVTGGLVKDVTVYLKADVQVDMREQQEVSNSTQSTIAQGTSTVQTQNMTSTGHSIIYRTDIDGSADQADMDIKKAIPELEQGFSRSVAGLF